MCDILNSNKIAFLRIRMGLKINKKFGGFTLIEAIAACCLVAFIVVAGFSFYPYYKQSLIRAEMRLAALNLARSTMEALCWDSTDVANTNGELNSPIQTADLGVLAKATNPIRLYSITTDSTGNYKIITVRVTWNY